MTWSGTRSLERTLARMQWVVVAVIAIATVSVGGIVGAFLSLRDDDGTSLALARALVKELDDHSADSRERLEDEIRSELAEQAAFGREIAIYSGERRIGATDVGLRLAPKQRRPGECATEPLDGRRWRVCSATASTGATVFVAAPLDRLTSATEILAGALLAAALSTSALFGLLSRRIVRRVLTPLDELRRDVGELRANELSFARRWQVSEIDSVAEAFDELLVRVGHAVERERRFVADASHELRTPLTLIRGQLDLLSSEPDARDASAMLKSAQRSCDLLVRTTESLLALAREEAALTETVDVSEIATEIAGGSESAARLMIDASEQVLVRGDPQLLRLAVNNLVDNALKYSNGRVTVHVSTAVGHAEVVIEDEGPGIPEADVPRLLQPFARGAPVGRRGTGLGLALVEHVARVHRGSIALGRAPGGGLKVTVTLPEWSATSAMPLAIS